MDFTFTAPSGIPPITFGSTTASSSSNPTTTTDAATWKSTTTSTTSTTTPSDALDSLDEHISLKRIHGVGDTKQWRRRLIHQIEDRIKDRREALHNAQRRGFVGSAGAGADGSSSGASNRIGGRGASGGFSGVAMVVGGGSQGPATGSLFGQGLAGGRLPVELGPGSAAASGNDTYISEEDERRIVAEVWEAFKNENYEALALAFQGMTDKEVEDIEQDILQHNYVTESGPMYETIMDMEETDMEEYVQQYMNQSEEGQIINDEMTNALSLAWTLLSRTPCIRCHQGAIVFEPVLPGSLAEGARALCSGAPGTGAGEGRGGCRFRLERDALLYLANAANTHSQTCAGQLQIAYDEDMGLLVACPHCDFLA
ncbi:hypothetical protein BGZ97_001501 [Linnemannia gamsii]|uniref:Uncharacterized protein n=1 Tax=Linnemannia gamsii TaxID=64522 RepID=A0A9P6RL94_9FUNG|nr:hypothetical protein BGZ97_001501 [Linnemannia gamsii]